MKLSQLVFFLPIHTKLFEPYFGKYFFPGGKIGKVTKIVLYLDFEMEIKNSGHNVS